MKANLEDRLTHTSKILMTNKLFKAQDEIKMATRGFLYRLIISEQYKMVGSIQCDVTLIRTVTNSADDDYGVQEVSTCRASVDVTDIL